MATGRLFSDEDNHLVQLNLYLESAGPSISGWVHNIINPLSLASVGKNGSLAHV